MDVLHQHYYTLSDLTRFWSYTDRSSPDGCWLWTGYVGPNGYGRFSVIGLDGKRKTLSAHRVALELTTGYLPSEVFACHRCDTPLCCRPDHLFRGTVQENNADKVLKNRQAYGPWHGRYTRPERVSRGEKRWNAKLTEEKVRQLRHEYQPRLVGIDTLAQKYGLSRNVVWRAVTRKSWKHVT